MTIKDESFSKSTFGSIALDKIVNKLRSTSIPSKRYEYLLWIAKKLPSLPSELHKEANKVQGCISEVYVFPELLNGRLFWKGYSDALITKGMLSLLIEGLNNLTPQEIVNIDPIFIQETGLNNTLTPSRANGFLYIHLKMKKEAQEFL